MNTAADADDAPFRDIHIADNPDADKPVPYRPTSVAGERYRILTTSYMDGSPKTQTRTSDNFVCCAGCGAELTIADWSTLDTAPCCSPAVRVCLCGVWLDAKWEVVR